MKLIRNDSFQNLNHSKEEILKLKDEDADIGLANLSSLRARAFSNDINLDIDQEEISQDVQQFQIVLQRNKTEKPQQSTMLDLIDEDCESGGTEKSVHFQESIKKDMKKLKQVNFEACEK